LLFISPVFDYLQQFNSLPQDLRDQVSSPSAMAALADLESKYRVDLAMVVMKIMIKSILPRDFVAYFASELALSPEQANSLAQDLKEKIFAPLADYLGFAPEKHVWDLHQDINALIKEAGLVLPSELLITRFKNVLVTYLKGVRSKIDTRATLAKEVNQGGLHLSPAEIDRVLKICDTQKFSNLAAAPVSPPPPTRLDKIINQAEKLSVGEYDLKKALAQKTIPPLSAKNELPAPEERLDLPAPHTTKSPAPVSPAPSPKPAPPVKPVAPLKTPPIITPPAPKSSFLAKLLNKREEKAGSQAPAPKIPPLAAKPAPQAPSPKIPAVPKPLVPPPPAHLSPAAIRPAQASPSRPQMQDVKPVPKVMGPIEELQFLDLVNFRRLGKTPAEITARLFAKIKLLEKEGYDKMVAGVKAWRQSPVNRLYLRIGQEAIAKGLSLKASAEARQQADQESLHWEEIEAIVSLNSRLVF